MNQDQQGRPWLALLICLMLAFGMTAPAWLAEVPSFIGHWDALDLPGSIWAHWWAAEALSSGANPFVDTVSFRPIGLDPVLQYNLFDALLGAPWISIFGVVVGYNIATIVALCTTGLGAYALGRSVKLSGTSAIFVAVAIQSSSAVSLELYEGRLSQFLLVFFLLGLALLNRLLHEPPRASIALGLGICTAATALVYWYAGLFFLIAAGAFTLVGGVQWTRKRLAWLLCSVAIGAVIVMPFVLDLVGQWDALPGMARATAGGSAHTNAVSLKSGHEIAIENSRWFLWPFLSRAHQEAGHQLSIILWVLVGVAARLKGVRLAGWGAVAAIGWMLALGPVYHGYDTTSEIAAPFGWLKASSAVFSRLWWPQRFEILTVIGVSVIAGLGLEHWLHGRKRAPWWWALSLVCLIADAPLRSGLLPVRASAAPQTHPELYRGLSGAVITTPIRPSVRILNHQRWAQTQHGMPILNGNGEHIEGHAPSAWIAWVDNSRILSGLITLGTDKALSMTVHPGDVQYLLDGEFRYVSVDPTVYGSRAGKNWAATHAAVFSQLWGKPVQRYRGGAVWEIQPITEDIPISVVYLNDRDRQHR
jgi:hypothetical protein